MLYCKSPGTEQVGNIEICTNYDQPFVTIPTTEITLPLNRPITTPMKYPIKKILLYGLFILVIASLLALTLVLGYLLMIAFFFCPIQSCWPQKIVLLLLTGGVAFALVWLLDNRDRWL